MKTVEEVVKSIMTVISVDTKSLSDTDYLAVLEEVFT